MAKHTGEPILLGFNAAIHAREMETRSDQDVVVEAMSVLRTIYS